MSPNSSAGVWYVSRPSAWAQSPSWLSFSTLLDLEACPRRWALSSADYPNIWKRHGYPRVPQSAALEGTMVHLALQRIMRALVERRCSSLLDKSAIATFRELGGYTAILMHSLDSALQPYEENPRATPVLEGVRRRLIGRIPELRVRIQRLLSRIHHVSSAASSVPATRQAGGQPRNQLLLGSHTEVELRVPELGWHGIVDLLTISTDLCEIRDFKTGIPKQEHDFQLRIYALLWDRDTVLNPSRRLADKLVLSYEQCDVQVPAPTADNLRLLEGEVRERTVAALASLQSDPAEARPSRDNCAYCSVRHLCEEYWRWQAHAGGDDPESANTLFTDLQIKLSCRHGPSSWDGVVEFASRLRTGAQVLLRTANLQFDLHPGQRLRLLNVYIGVPDEQSMSDKSPPIVVTMGGGSEAFLLP